MVSVGVIQLMVMTTLCTDRFIRATVVCFGGVAVWSLEDRSKGQAWGFAMR
jgi:hypothetical protein